MRDLHNNIKVSPAIDPAAIITGNATKTGKTIDTVGFDSLEFAVASGALTDGTYTSKLFESDTINEGTGALTNATEVADKDRLGDLPAFTAADDSAVKRVGYIGSKRYVRIDVVQAGATTGGFLAAVAIQGHAKIAPVAE